MYTHTYTYVYIHTHIYIYIYIYVFTDEWLCIIISFYTSLCTGKQQQKPLSSSWFGTLKACIPTSLLLRRSVFFADTGSSTVLLSASASPSTSMHPVSITRFPLRRFSPGAGLLRNPFFLLARGWVRKDGSLLRETGCKHKHKHQHQHPTPAPAESSEVRSVLGL